MTSPAIALLDHSGQIATGRDGRDPGSPRLPSAGLGGVYEETVDGWRCLTYKDTAGVRLISRNRNGRDLTHLFPSVRMAGVSTTRGIEWTCPRGARHARSMSEVGPGALPEERSVS